MQALCRSMRAARHLRAAQCLGLMGSKTETGQHCAAQSASDTLFSLLGALWLSDPPRFANTPARSLPHLGLRCLVELTLEHECRLQNTHEVCAAALCMTGGPPAAPAQAGARFVLCLTRYFGR